MSLVQVIKSTDALTLNRKVSKKLVQLINLEHLQMHKLSAGNKRLPDSPLALYTRAASVLIKLVQNPTSIAKLATKYNRKSNRGVKPSIIRPAARAILRKICNTLASANLLAKCIKGRYTTSAGKQLIIQSINETK